MVARNLPSQPTLFIGREDELTEIANLPALPACRLLTLIGPGGIGKTRLALEAARVITDGVGAVRESPIQPVLFSNGVFFVPLQPLTSSDFIVPAIAEALHFQFYPGSEPEQQLLDNLREKFLLLVLDNFEHLRDGVDLLPKILENTVSVKLLVTSRERLRLREEWVFDVRGLTFPEYELSIGLDDYPSVKLFVQSARRVVCARR